jgi:large subunit ribosomal protein L31e
MGKGDLGKTDLVTREHTIHLAKLLHRVTFKKKTPRAIRAIKKFASTAMGTSDVRIAPALNKALWSRGVRHTPRRIRVRLSRKRNDDEEADEALFTLVEHVPVADFKELETKVVDEIAEDE